MDDFVIELQDFIKSWIKYNFSKYINQSIHILKKDLIKAIDEKFPSMVSKITKLYKSEIDRYFDQVIKELH